MLLLKFRLLLSLIFFNIIFLATNPAAAAEWSIPRVVIEAEIRPDGSVFYTEHRTYRFEGSFSEADYILPRQGFTELTELRVYDNGSPMMNLNTKEPGSFLIQESNRDIHITLYYRAQDEERTFTIQYILKGAVVTGPDYSEFNWIYLSNRWDRPTDELIVSLSLPGNPPDSEIHTWIRGAEEKTTIEREAGVMRATAGSVLRSEQVQIRTLFPSAGLQIPVNDPALSLKMAEEQETAWRDERLRRAEIEARNDIIGLWVSVILLIIGLVVLISLYNRYGRRYHPPQQIPHEIYEIPVDEPPAIMGWLYARTYIGGAQLMATLLDLARRGYFRIEQFKTESSFLKSETTDFYVISTDKQPGDDLTEWEYLLLQFLKEETSEGKKPLTKIFGQGSAKSMNLAREWNIKVDADAKTRVWYDPDSKIALVRNLLFQLALTTVSVLGMIFLSISFIILLIGSVMLAVLSLIILRRTEHGELAYRRIVAYRNALGKGKTSEFITPKDKTVHLLYAIALGVTGKQFEHLTENLNLNNISWLYYHGGVFNPAQLATTLNTLAATGTSTVASVAGGAGATAGSAGGGAGGGAR